MVNVLLFYLPIASSAGFTTSFISLYITVLCLSIHFQSFIQVLFPIPAFLCLSLSTYPPYLFSSASIPSSPSLHPFLPISLSDSPFPLLPSLCSPSPVLSLSSLPASLSPFYSSSLHPSASPLCPSPPLNTLHQSRSLILSLFSRHCQIFLCQF